MSKDLVSVIIPTYNSAQFLEETLKSIKKQTYPYIEIIVVDNFSQDSTKRLALKYTDKVFEKGPERSFQRNFGAEKAKGKYLLFLDADMILEKKVIEGCVKKIKEDKKIKAIIIPEKSWGKGFWAKCRKLEKEFYQGADFIEAPRFLEKEAFLNIGGFDPNLISGEDWDLAQRIRKKYKIARIESFIYHNEGKLSLFKILKKKFYYAQHIERYFKKHKNENQLKYQINLFYRYFLFLKKPKKLFKNPFLGTGLLIMKLNEFIAGFLGYLWGKIKKSLVS